MTLIVAMAPRGIPVIVGDLILSGPTSEKRSAVYIPTLGDVTDFFGDSGWGIHGLRQKIRVIGPKLAIAWTGSLVGAGVAIRNLATRFETADVIEPEALIAILRETPELKDFPASFVGWISVNSGFIQFSYGDDIRTCTSSVLGKVAFGGSGGDAVNKISALFSAASIDSRSGQYSPYSVAPGMAAAFASLLLRAEQAAGDMATTIRNAFGGGYEIISFRDGGFAKYTDLTYVFWEATVLNENVDLVPIFIVVQSYVGDTLLIRRLGIVGADNSQVALTGIDTYPVYPIGMVADRIEVGRLVALEVLESRSFCNCVIVNKGSILTHTIFNESESPQLYFETTDNLSSLRYTPKFAMTMSQAIYQTAKGIRL